MRLILAKLICRFSGHKHGKFVGLTTDSQKNVILRTIKCPRCDATWSRKNKEAA